MVQGRKALTRRSLALTLLVMVALEGCVTYPSAVPTKGQDSAIAERDAAECRQLAEKEVLPPVAVGFGTKLLWALGGAVVGAGVFWPSGNTDPRYAALAMGAGAGLGFVIGSIVGTFKGADEASRAARGREHVFARCMTERGYRLEK